MCRSASTGAPSTRVCLGRRPARAAAVARRARRRAPRAARRRVGRPAPRRSRAPRARAAVAQLRVLEQPQRDGARELGRARRERQPARVGLDQRGGRRVVGRRDRDPGRERLEREPRRAVARGDEDRGAAQQRPRVRAGWRPARCACPRAGAGAHASRRARPRRVAARAPARRRATELRLPAVVSTSTRGGTSGCARSSRELDAGRDQVPAALAGAGAERLEHCGRARDERVGEAEAPIAAAGRAERGGQRGVERRDADRAALARAAVRA